MVLYMIYYLYSCMIVAVGLYTLDVSQNKYLTGKLMFSVLFLVTSGPQ